ncbi:MAG: pyrimidine-nucleoside phosphorylase [Eubacterium sp.]|nr:pyrimidine-nucleoside phosphorylase [Eubacterium sp.]
MRMVDLIIKKRDGGELTDDEIQEMISRYISGDIPDYQMSSMLMAIYNSGMNDREITTLTLAMRDSGELVDLSPIPGIKIDKHSTGGVGDKTTMIIGPIVAACGIPVAKMSGRGLGFTGGTVDKFESIPGYRTTLPMEDFFRTVREHGISVIGQSGELAPADKALYALRDVTGTIESIPLIASSIMSKKLAAGADKIVLDVTVGSGAFMQDIDRARELAKRMVAIGNGAGRETVAMLTNMNQPLGHAIGNNLEVKEVIEVLHGRGPEDLREVCFALAGMMISLASGAANTTGALTDESLAHKLSYEQGMEIARGKIADGSALVKFRELISAQGGDVSYIDDPSKFSTAPAQCELIAESDGYISMINTMEFGLAAGRLGAGRTTKEDVIDMRAGIIMHKKLGDEVHTGDVVATIYGGSQGCPDRPLDVIEENMRAVTEDLKQAYTVSSAEPDRISEILEIIRGGDI